MPGMSPALRPRERPLICSKRVRLPVGSQGDAMTKAIILLPLVMLAACDSGASVSATNASVEEVAKKVEAARLDETFFRAGKWTVKGQVDDVQVPGMPPELAAQMKQRGRDMPGTESCVTEADAKKPAADFFTGNKSCKYDHFTMGGGKIDARMRCGAGGGTQLTTMTGTYGAETYRMALTTAMENPAQGGASEMAQGMAGMTMKLSVEGKRIGDCDPASKRSNTAREPTPATRSDG